MNIIGRKQNDELPKKNQRFEQTVFGQMTRSRSKDKIGLHLTLRYTFLFARAMGLLPLSGLYSKRGRDVRFTLMSPYSVFYGFTLVGQLFMGLINFFWLCEKGLSLANFSNGLFYVSNLAICMILTDIAKCWSKFLAKVEDLEAKLPAFHGKFMRFIDIAVFCFIFLAAVEHSLAVLYGFTIAKACAVRTVGEAYFSDNMPWIFAHTSYSLWKGILFEIFNIQSTFLWTYGDILIMLLGIYLSEHFAEHNRLLKQSLLDHNFSAEEFRLHHLRILKLIKLFNKRFGINILISFGSNSYWICKQLFYVLNKNYTGFVNDCDFRHRSKYDTLHSLEYNIYFTFSFSFLCARTLLVAYLSARVHTMSKKSLLLLYSLPAYQFNLEVERWIDQINNVKGGLSGSDFFFVTKTMILTLIGTLVTYELVLLQFNK